MFIIFYKLQMIFINCLLFSQKCPYLERISLFFLFLLDLTLFCTILPDSAWFCLILPSLIWKDYAQLCHICCNVVQFYLVLPNFTRFLSELFFPTLAEFAWIARFCKTLPILPTFSRFCIILPDFARFFLILHSSALLSNI